MSVLDDWLRVAQVEYLDDFLPSGGSAVKFVSGDSLTLERVKQELQELSSHRNFHHVLLEPDRLLENGKKPDLHRTDRLFFAISRSLEWKRVAAHQAHEHLRSLGLRLQPGRALNDVEGIADDNELSGTDLLGQFRRELTNRHLRDRRMGAEFRNAVAALVHAQLVPDTLTPTTEETIVHWLCGVSAPGGSRALRQVQIYERISAANAWTMLRSLAHWVSTTAGYRGMTLVLDFRPYEAVRVPMHQLNAQITRATEEALNRGATAEEIAAIHAAYQRQPTVVYSPQAYMRMLALLRHFIDSIALLPRTLLLVLASPGYLSDLEPVRNVRNYRDYNALQTRIGQEVRDTHYPNLSAALVHLGEAA